MAQDSRNTKRKRRMKRNISLVSREAQKMLIQLRQTQFMLFQVLEQSGGSITVTRETSQTILQHLQGLGWKTEGTPEGMKVVLVKQFEVKAEEPTPVEVVNDGPQFELARVTIDSRVELSELAEVSTPEGVD